MKRFLSSLLIKAIVIASVAVATWSCSHNFDNEPPEIRRALDKAGRNRGQLEKVLLHYANDSLRLEAARFLIGNMSGHYGYDGSALDSVESVLAEISTRRINYILTDSMRERLKFPFFLLPRLDDVRTLKASVLIDNIDQAFEMLEKRPWNRDLPFEDFCELLLPYCIGDERWTVWRKTYYDYYAPKLDSLYQGDDVVEAARILQSLVSERPMYYNDELVTPHRDALSLFKSRVGFNRDVIDRLLYAMRACGIPVAIDQVIVTPYSGASHQWLVVRDNKTGRYIPFGYDGMIPSRDSVQWDMRKKGKVFRTTYAQQPEHFERFQSIRSLPVKFNNPFLKDVTADYFGHNVVKVPVYAAKSNIFLTIQGPATGRLRAIDGGEIQDSVATFTDLEPGVYYIPAFEHRASFYPGGYPFVIENDGKVKILEPDTLHWEKVKLTRVMPYSRLVLHRLADGVIGGVLEASADSTFDHADVVFEISDTLRTNYWEIPMAFPDKEYQYLRYTAPEGRRLVVAELEAYGDMEKNDTLQLRILGSFGKGFTPQDMIDGDITTTFTAPEGVHSVTLGFDTPQKIKKIVFSPRNDNFFIWHDDEYEVSYHAGIRGWIPVDTILAKGGQIVTRVPRGALLLIRDLTNPTYAGSFTMKGGKQWWPIDYGRFNTPDVKLQIIDNE
ncbi:MAG: hypothetical protein LIO90_00990 [Bacteroidales bacterium]|nr:hypothetical protein [Bacteroidales bacterium]